jgi:hypothetical protein
MSNVNEQNPAQDPLIVGELTTEENSVLQRLRSSMNGYLLEIGQLEVAKARLLGAIQNTEERANDVMKKVSERLDIGEKVQWQVTPDNKVRILPNVQEAKNNLVVNPNEV